MTPLLIADNVELRDPDTNDVTTINVIQKIAEQVSFAKAHRYDLATMKRMEAGQGPVIPSIDDHHIFIPMAYLVSLTVEEFPEVGWVFHMSLSNRRARPGDAPGLPVVEEVISHYGFPALDRCQIETETDPENGSGVFHILAAEADCGAPRKPDLQTALNIQYAAQVKAAQRRRNNG